jgi:hypothetical protein
MVRLNISRKVAEFIYVSQCYVVSFPFFGSAMSMKQHFLSIISQLSFGYMEHYPELYTGYLTLFLLSYPYFEFN